MSPYIVKIIQNTNTMRIVIKIIKSFNFQRWNRCPCPPPKALDLFRKRVPLIVPSSQTHTANSSTSWWQPPPLPRKRKHQRPNQTLNHKCKLHQLHLPLQHTELRRMWDGHRALTQSLHPRVYVRIFFFLFFFFLPYCPSSLLNANLPTTSN